MTIPLELIFGIGRWISNKRCIAVEQTQWYHFADGRREEKTNQAETTKQPAVEQKLFVVQKLSRIVVTSSSREKERPFCRQAASGKLTKEAPDFLYRCSIEAWSSRQSFSLRRARQDTHTHTKAGYIAREREKKPGSTNRITFPRISTMRWSNRDRVS